MFSAIAPPLANARAKELTNNDFDILLIIIFTFQLLHLCHDTLLISVWIDQTTGRGVK
jgi:hypothetical protein